MPRPLLSGSVGSTRDATNLLFSTHESFQNRLRTDADEGSFEVKPMASDQPLSLAIDVIHLALQDLETRLQDRSIFESHRGALSDIATKMSAFLRREMRVSKFNHEPSMTPKRNYSSPEMERIKNRRTRALSIRKRDHESSIWQTRLQKGDEPHELKIFAVKEELTVAPIGAPPCIEALLAAGSVGSPSDLKSQTSGSTKRLGSKSASKMMQPWEEPLICLFKEIDKDGGGTLTTAELREGLRLLDLAPARAAKIIKCADTDGSGEIDFLEWCNVIRTTDTPEIRELGEKLLEQKRGGGYLTNSNIQQYRMMVHPNGKVRMTWDFLVMLFLMYIAIMWPFLAAFESTISDTVLDAFDGVDRTIDALFIVDIFLNFRTGYEDEVGRIILKPSWCACKYLKTWFFLDFFSSIPLGLLANVSSVQAVKLVKLAKIARVLKIVAPRKGASHFVDDFIDEVCSSTFLQMIYRRGRICILTIVLCHWLACGMRFAGDGFLKDYQDVSGNLSSEYMSAWYWAMTTMATVGYGDITPHADVERFYCILAMVLGGTFYGYVVGNICSMVASHDLNASAYYDRMDHIQAWIEHHKFPQAVRLQVRRYFKQLLMTKSAIDDGVIVDDLTADLKEVVGEYLINPEIRHNLLFDGVAMGAIVRIQKIVQRAIMLRGHHLAKFGEPGVAMVIIYSGTARMKQIFEIEDDFETIEEEVEETLAPGDSFGEEVLVEFEDVYQYNVTAIGDIVVYQIPCHPFWDLFKAMPSVVKALRSNALHLVERKRAATLKAKALKQSMTASLVTVADGTAAES